MGQALEFTGSLVNQGLNDMFKALRRIETLQVFLLNSIDQELTECSTLLGRHGGQRGGSSRRTIASTGRRTRRTTRRTTGGTTGRTTRIGRTRGVLLSLNDEQVSAMLPIRLLRAKQRYVVRLLELGTRPVRRISLGCGGGFVWRNRRRGTRTELRWESRLIIRTRHDEEREKGYGKKSGSREKIGVAVIVVDKMVIMTGQWL